MATPAADAFARALDAVFNRWSLLNLAIEHSFAGPDTEAKAEWFYDCVLNYFATSKDVDLLDLEDYLNSFLSEEFECDADDGSARQVAELTLVLHKQAQDGEWEKLGQFIASELALVKNRRPYYQDPNAPAPAAPAPAPAAPSAPVEDTAQELARLDIGHASPMDGQEQAAPAAEDDGWETVGSKKGRRKH